MNASCLANPTFNIIYSNIIACCFQDFMKDKKKEAFVPVAPIVLSVAGLGLAFFTMIVSNRLNRDETMRPLLTPGTVEDQSLQSRVAKAASDRVTLSITRLMLTILWVVCAATIFGLSFLYPGCPSWVENQMAKCICSAPSS